MRIRLKGRLTRRKLNALLAQARDERQPRNDGSYTADKQRRRSSKDPSQGIKAGERQGPSTTATRVRSWTPLHGLSLPRGYVRLRSTKPSGTLSDDVACLANELCSRVSDP